MAPRYARILEQSPALLERLQAASEAGLGLTDEVALARTLLDETLAELARAHAEEGQLDRVGTTALLGQLQQVQGLVRDAAAIEAKRGDQRLSAAAVLGLLGGLRDELRRALGAAFGDRARAAVDDVFDRARWTGDLSPDALREALEAPAGYEVRFRYLDRDPAGKVREAGRALELSELEAEAIAAPDAAGGPPSPQD